MRERSADFAEIWPRESGILHSAAATYAKAAPNTWDYYADLSATYPFFEPAKPTAGTYGMIVREPVGVVGSIVPWNGPLPLFGYKIAPALLAGCTVILKASPEAPGAAYVLAEIAEAVGLPRGVLNVVMADRDVSEMLVTDPRVDKISFTGSTAAGRRIGSIMGGRVGRVTLELGGKSAALVLNDFDLSEAANTIATAELQNTGQICSSLTRVIVGRDRHDELLGELVSIFSQVRVGDPFDPASQMGPLASERQRDRVEVLIGQGKAEGAEVAIGGRRPKHLDRGFFIEPTIFGNVNNFSTIAQQEIFGPVLTVIPADSESHAIEIANDTIYGLNASVFTSDVQRAFEVARQLRSGTVGHNAFRTDFGIAFGGFKQSGIGREGSREGLLPYLETKTVVLEGIPTIPQ
jgi:acyl-CoA reductase-like NAD-dependent aldehyde dehydrogenase